MELLMLDRIALVSLFNGMGTSGGVTVSKLD